MSDAQKQAAMEIAVSEYHGGDLTICQDHLAVVPADEGFFVKAWIFVHEHQIQSRL